MVFQQQNREEGRVCEKGCCPNTSSATRQPRRQRHQLQPSDGLFPINLHGLMEGWKGRGNEEEEGEEAIILIITVDTFLHQKEVKVHIKRTPGSLHDNYPFRHWLMGLRPERVLSEGREEREEEEREWALDGCKRKDQEENRFGLGFTTDMDK